MKAIATKASPTICCQSVADYLWQSAAIVVLRDGWMGRMEGDLHPCTSLAHRSG